MLDIGTRNQVFIDGRFLAERENVDIVVQQPLKTGERNIVSGKYTHIGGTRERSHPPTLEGEHEIWVYSQVMENDGVFKGFECVSKNGTDWNWTTPEILDSGDFAYGFRVCQQPVLKWKGRTPLNFGIVFSEPNAVPSERYKLVSAWQNKAFASADGTEWKVLGSGMFPKSVWTPFPDAQNVVFYDDSLGEYTAFIRHWRHPDVPPQHQSYFDASEIWEKKNALRVIARLTSKDLSSFSEPQVVLEPDDDDPIMDGVAVMDFHSPAVMKYTQAQDAYILFNHPYLHYQDWFIAEDLSHYFKEDNLLNSGSLDIRIAASRDGITWEQYDRKPAIPLGMNGAFDDLMVWPVYGFICHGDEIWVYFVSNPAQNLPVEGIEAVP